MQKLLRICTNLVDKYEINFNEIMKFSAAYSESAKYIREFAIISGPCVLKRHSSQDH